MKKKSNYTLDELIEQITSSVDPSWDILKQIRYVYIELGLYLEKNTNFFMSVMNKVQSQYKLSSSEIRNIYNDNLEDGTRKDWDKVICRSAAIILSKCLTKLNIDNKIINTTNAIMFGEDNDLAEIRHVFVNAKLNEDESIFLTLAADLPFIQNNLETQMFGNLIGYKKIDDNGIETQLYEGEEIKDAIKIDKDTLLQIDADLGYATSIDENDTISYVYGDYFFDYIRKQLSKNKLYYELLVQETPIYRTILGNKLKEDITDEILELRSMMFDTCSYISSYLDFEYPFTSAKEFNYQDWKSKIEPFVEELDKNPNNELHVNGTYTNLIKITDSLIDVISDMATSILSSESTPESIQQYREKFNKKMIVLGKLFVNSEYLQSFDEYGYVNQNYIAKKLEVMFKYIFGCNEERREFNDLSYNEQIAIIRIVIPLIFSDVKDKDCFSNDKRSKCMSCIYNIIRSYTLRMINDGSYEIIFEIDNSNDPMYYTYNLTSNKMKKVTQTRFYFHAVNNIICSKDLKDKLKIEDVDDNEKRR